MKEISLGNSSLTASIFSIMEGKKVFNNQIYLILHWHESLILNLTSF